VYSAATYGDGICLSICPKTAFGHLVLCLCILGGRNVGKLLLCPNFRRLFFMCTIMELNVTSTVCTSCYWRELVPSFLSEACTRCNSGRKRTCLVFLVGGLY